MGPPVTSGRATKRRFWLTWKEAVSASLAILAAPAMAVAILDREEAAAAGEKASYLLAGYWSLFAYRLYRREPEAKEALPWWGRVVAGITAFGIILFLSEQLVGWGMNAVGMGMFQRGQHQQEVQKAWGAIDVRLAIKEGVFHAEQRSAKETRSHEWVINAVVGDKTRWFHVLHHVPPSKSHDLEAPYDVQEITPSQADDLLKSR